MSLVLSPNLADKTTHSMLSFVLENLIKPLGSSCIPLEVYRRSVYLSHFLPHVRESKIVLDSMLWILDSGFLSLVGFWILLPMIPDSTGKNWQDSGNWIPLHRVTLNVLNMANTVSSETKNETRLSVKDTA